MKYLSRRYKIRRATTRGGHEITLPPDWVRAHDGHGDVELLYGLVVVIVPDGISVDLAMLDRAVKEI